METTHEDYEESGPPIEITTVKVIVPVLQLTLKYYRTKGKYPRPGPRLVRQELERLGFVYAPPEVPLGLYKQYTDAAYHLAHCQAIWAMHMDKSEVSSLMPFQTVNWFPAMPEITIKDLLHRNLFRMQKNYGVEVSFN
jgi:hypothetical protein